MNRTSSYLIGTSAAAETVAAGATRTATTATYPGTNSLDVLAVAVVFSFNPPAPTSNPTVQFAYSFDGTAWINDGGPYLALVTPSTTVSIPLYEAPATAIAVRVTIQNGTDNPCQVVAIAATRSTS